ncbi:unnamed protein product [Urochloa humidicola]
MAPRAAAARARTPGPSGDAPWTSTLPAGSSKRAAWLPRAWRCWVPGSLGGRSPPLMPLFNNLLWNSSSCRVLLEK